MKQFLQTRRVFVFILASGLFIMAARTVTDPDVWWHLRTGQLILQNHAVFHGDPYSFTRSGQAWLDHEWLSQIIIYGVYRIAGWGGLIASFAAIIASAFLVVYGRSGGRPFIAGLVTVWGAVASIPIWGVRPQMFTLLFASIFLVILEGAVEHPRRLWWLPPLMLLWVNLHAGFATGIALLLAFLIGDGLDLALGHNGNQLSPSHFRRLALVTVASAAAIAINPYGLQMYRYPVATLHSRAMQAYIGEWFSPDFHQARYLPFLLLILATVALPALTPRRMRARELLLLVVATYAALRSVRHVPLYVIVAVPLVSSMIEGCLLARGKTGLITGDSRVLPKKMLVANGLLLAAFLGFAVYRFHYVVLHQPEAEAKEFPEAAAAFLLKNHVPGPMLNHYNWGGYFIWKLFPTYSVYIDGRADVYGDAFMDEFAAVYYVSGASWPDPIRKWGVETVVLPPDAPLISALRAMPSWRQVFADEQTVILTRAPDSPH